MHATNKNDRHKEFYICDEQTVRANRDSKKQAKKKQITEVSVVLRSQVEMMYNSPKHTATNNISSIFVGTIIELTAFELESLCSINHAKQNSHICDE